MLLKQYINGEYFLERSVEMVQQTNRQTGKTEARFKKSIMMFIGLFLLLTVLIIFVIWRQLSVTKTVDLQQNPFRSMSGLTVKNTYKKVGEPIEIVFAGDTMFDWELRPILEREGYEYPFTYVKDTVQQADYSFINLESVITTEQTAKDPHQLFWIKSDPEVLEGLKKAGFQMINIGNNHTLDYLRPGLLDTLHYVKKYEFDYIGAGENEEEAYRSKEININGKTFRFFSFVRFFPSANWVATDDQPGVPNGYDLSLVKKTIEEQKEDSDYVIVYFHWGIEKTNMPAEYQKQYVAALKELGVDLIVGSHPHWLQGFAYEDGTAVAYSLGNFLFPPYVQGHTAATGLLKVTFTGDNGQMAFEPYIISNGQIQPLKESEKKRMYTYLQSISFNVDIRDDGQIIEK